MSMDSFNAIETIFSLSDTDLSQNIESILARKCQITIQNLVAACKDSQLIRTRLVNNSRLHGDTVIILALKFNCETLFKCIIKILAKENSMQKQFNREVIKYINTKEKFIWIASLEEDEIKWVMRQAMEIPAHLIFVKVIIKEMDSLGRNMNMFYSGYNPMAHAVYINDCRVYQKLTATAINHIKSLDGEPIIFRTVKTMDFPFVTDTIQTRMKMWRHLITQESLLEAQIYGTNLFTRAIEERDIPLLVYLIENHRETLSQLSSRELPLNLAIKTGSIVTVEKLLLAHFSAVEKNDNGITPLQTAFYSECVRMAEMTLENVIDSDIYTLDNLCAAMSASKWWLAKEILTGIQRTCELPEIFGEGMSFEAIRLQIDAMTTRSMLRKQAAAAGERLLNYTLPAQTRINWCQRGINPRVLGTNGRDWWDLACINLHVHPGVSLDTEPRM